MLKLLRNRLGLVLAGLVAALAPMLMAPTGGFPSRPLFQAVGVGVAVPATGIVNALTDVQVNGASLPKLASSNTWTAIQTFSPTTAQAAILNGTDGANTVIINGSPTTNLSFGLSVRAGTNSSDTAFQVNNAANTLDYFKIDGAGNISVPNATSVPWAVSTSGTFTATLSTGCTTTPTTTAKWAKTGNLVMIEYAGFSSCTSNSALASTDSSIPAAIRPPVTHGLGPIVDAEDNGGRTLACVSVLSGGSLSFSLFTTGAGFNGCSGTSFTNSGTKGFGGGFVVSYQLAN